LQVCKFAGLQVWHRILTTEGTGQMNDGLPWQSYQAWIEQVPRSIREDALWSFETYRKALFLADLA
jgi:hypothetical protein